MYPRDHVGELMHRLKGALKGKLETCRVCKGEGKVGVNGKVETCRYCRGRGEKRYGNS